MQICSQTKNPISVAGTCRGNYKAKAENVKKLKIYLKKIEK